ncbi:hypothetical protein QUA00_29075 [Microcoleus sp. T2B6]|uniref:hypothetical protein n=1 Tax=Microcoleus sp. T2B6 TaxID=3055424 RepID=UPI002FD5F872
MNERLIDLDELVTHCKEEDTKEYIKEAVACYKGGAFRSCIVATWNAVVFDYLNKLRQLELGDDPQAKEKLKNFRHYSSSKNYSKLWEFELSIPKSASKDFEFISSIEQVDLERLHEDRSRCAHPSILLDEEPFQPTPELARYHLRNAVTHLLQYPPVHGRVAIVRVRSMIESAGFPENTEDAIKILKDSYLSRGRATLIKDVVIDLTKALLISEEVENKTRDRMYAALGAISQLHVEHFEKIMSNKLLSTIESVEDKKWHRVFTYLRRLQLWDFLKEKQKIQVKGFIQNIDLKKWEDILMLLDALDSPKEIQTFALEKLKAFPELKLRRLIELIAQNNTKIRHEKDFVQQLIQPYKSDVVQEFINFKSGFSIISHAGSLMSIAKWLDSEEIKSVLKAFRENDKISQAPIVPTVMTHLFQETVQKFALLKDEWLLIKAKIENDLAYAQLLQLINDNCSDTV